MDDSESLEELRRAVRADPGNDALIERLRILLDRIHGARPVCARCGLSTHMARGRIETKRYSNWTEAAEDAYARDLGFKEQRHIVGWRCLICNIIVLGTVERRDMTFDWVNHDM